MVERKSPGSNPYQQAYAEAIAEIRALQADGQLSWLSEIADEEAEEDYHLYLTKVYREYCLDSGLSWPPQAARLECSLTASGELIDVGF